MTRFLLILLPLLLVFQQSDAQQTVSSGKLVEYPNFQSSIVAPRDVFVWLPSDYSAKKKYDVLYMHDGQMLFDANYTWNKQEWGIDEVVGKLLDEKRINSCIIVGTKKMVEVLVGKDKYYIPEKKISNLLSSKEIIFKFTRKDLIEVNHIIHADLL